MHLVVSTICCNNFMLQCSIALAITVATWPLSATHVQNRGRINYPNINTTNIKKKFLLCKSGRLMGGGIAPHILKLRTACRKVASFTSTIIGKNKCVVLYVADNDSGFHIWGVVGNMHLVVQHFVYFFKTSILHISF